MKKFLVIMLAIICIFSVVGCGKEEDISNKNMATQLLQPSEGESYSMLTYWISNAPGLERAESIRNKTIQDLVDGNVESKNYERIEMKWQKSYESHSWEYKITKIEFDLIAEEAFDLKIILDDCSTNPNEIEQSKSLVKGENHIVLEYDLTKNDYCLMIRFIPKDMEGYFKKFKISNFYVTAEKL